MQFKHLYEILSVVALLTVFAVLPAHAQEPDEVIRTETSTRAVEYRCGRQAGPCGDFTDEERFRYLRRRS